MLSVRPLLGRRKNGDKLIGAQVHVGEWQEYLLRKEHNFFKSNDDATQKWHQTLFSPVGKTVAGVN